MPATAPVREPAGRDIFGRLIAISRILPDTRFALISVSTLLALRRVDLWTPRLSLNQRTTVIDTGALPDFSVLQAYFSGKAIRRHHLGGLVVQSNCPWHVMSARFKKTRLVTGARLAERAVIAKDNRS